MKKLLEYAKAFTGLVLTILYFAIEEDVIPEEYTSFARVAFAAAIWGGIWAVPNKGFTRAEEQR